MRPRLPSERSEPESGSGSGWSESRRSLRSRRSRRSCRSRRGYGRRRAGAVDEGVDHEVRADLREARGRRRLGEVDLVDREQATGGIERAPPHVDEVAQAVEEVRQVVEVALELDRDRDREVPGDRRRSRRGRDLLEVDAAVLGDLVQLEDDPGHVDLIRHRLGQAVEIGDADLGALLCLHRQGARGRDRVVRVRDLRVQVGCLRPLRADQHEPAAEAGQHEAEHDECDHDRLRDAALHCVAPGRRTSATMMKWTALAVPTSVRVLCWSCTLTRSGTTASRLSSRATAGCE